jgi:hypothetical protein
MSRNLTTRRGAAFIVAVSATVAGAAVGVPSAFATADTTPVISKTSTPILAANEATSGGVAIKIKLTGKNLADATQADIGTGARCQNLPVVATATTVEITVPIHVAPVVDDVSTPADETAAEVLAGCAPSGSTAETVKLAKLVSAVETTVAEKAALVTFVTRVKAAAAVEYSDAGTAGDLTDDTAGVDPVYLVNGANVPAQLRSWDLNQVGGQVVQIDADSTTPFSKKVVASVKVGEKWVKLTPTNKLTDSNTYLTAKMPKFTTTPTALKFSITDKGLTSDDITSKLNVKAVPVVTGVSPTSGAYVAASASGSLVQVKGSGFGTAAAEVKICGQVATVATGDKIKPQTDKLISVLAPKWNTTEDAGSKVCPVVVTVAGNASSLNGTSVYTYVTD